MYATVVIIFLIQFFFHDVSKAKLIMEVEVTDGHAVAECIKRSKWQLKNVAMISNEIDEVPYAEQIIKALSSPVMILKNDSEISFHEVTLIVFSIKRYFYYNILKQVKVADRARVIIIWKWPNNKFEKFDRNKAMGTLQDILSIMWFHQIYDVYVLVEDKHSDVQVYTYSPFGETHCNDVGPPLLIDTWDSTKKRFTTNRFKIEQSTNSTRFQLMRNLYGCPIRVLVKNRPPESVALMSSDNKLILKGSGGSILATMMNKYNFTINIKLAEDGIRTSFRDKLGMAISIYKAKLLMRDLRTEQYDFAFGVFSHLMYFSSDMDLSIYYMNENFAFYVPCGTIKGIFSIWSNYHKEFSVSTWAGIVLVFFSTAFTFKIIALRLPRENPIFLSFWRNVFSLWAVHVENNVEATTKTLAMRVLVMALMFYCTTMSVAYRASLKSLLLAPLEESSIKTWEELDQSNFSIYGIPDMYTILKKVSSEHKTLRKLRKKFQLITNENFKKVLDEIRIKRNIAFFAPESVISFYYATGNLEKGTRNGVCQVNRIVASSPASPFLMKKGSMFLDIINHVTNRMVQAGHMRTLDTPQGLRKLHSKQNIRDDQLPTSLQQLKGAFLLLLAGLVLAAVVFALEIFYLWYKQRRFSILRKK